MLARILELDGHDVALFFLKGREYVPIPFPRERHWNYETMSDGKLIGCGHDELPWTDHEVEQLQKKLQALEPDVLAFSSRSPLDEVNALLLERLRQGLPTTRFVAGGYGPSLRPEHYLKVCDHVLIGDGETSMPAYCRAIDGQDSFSNVPNLAHVQEGRLHVNPLAPVVDDLDSLPYPLYYTPNIFTVDANALEQRDPATPKKYNVLMGRGCVGSCSYCSAGQWGSLYAERGQTIPVRRNRSIDNTIAELAAAKARGGEEVQFLDSYLAGTVSFLTEFLRRYRDEIGLPFFANLHFGQIVEHPRLLDAAMEAGLNFTVAGFQHGDDAFAKEVYHRKVSNKTLLEASARLVERGCKVGYHFIGGNPLERPEHFERHLEFVKKLPFVVGQTHITVYTLVNFPKTPLTKVITANNLPPRPRDEWRYRAMLTSIRPVVDDARFKEFRDSEVFRNHPSYLEALYPSLQLEHAIKEKQILHDPIALRTLFTHYTRESEGQEVFVWGTGENYEKVRGHFYKTTIRAFIDNDRSRWGTTKDGRPVVGPEALLEAPDVPLFICSTHRKDIVQQIRRDYGGSRLVV